MSSSNDDNSSGGDKIFKFQIVNGQVTAVFELDDGVWEAESLTDHGKKSYTVEGSDVIRTEIKPLGTEISRYSDSDGDGLYNRVSEQWQPSSNAPGSGSSSNDDNSSGGHKVFKFDITNGQVTAVFELDDGVLESKSLTDNGRKSYTVDGSDVIRTELKPFGTEITRYSDPDGDGLFSRVSEQWQVSPNAGNGVIPKFTGNLSYSGTSGDDFIAVRGGEDCHGGQGADDFIFREANHLRIQDFRSQDGDMLVFDTGLGLTSREHLASYITDSHHDGQNFIVNFGSDVSITLVGVQPDQIGWDDVSVMS